MKSPRLRATLIGLATATAIAACGSTWVVVPPPADGYSSADTLRGYLDGDYVHVVFRFDTITSTRVVTRTDTVFTEGTDTVFRVKELLRVDTVAVTDTIRYSDTMVRIDSILRVDTVFRADTVRLTATDTVQVTLTDTIRLAATDTVRVAVTDTVFRTDTVAVTGTDTVRVAVTDTIRVAVTDTVVRTDTIAVTDTIRVAVTDTVVRIDTVAVTDTIRVAVTDTVFRTDTVTVTIPGRRLLFVPPGHYPPDGECRVWIHGLPPGQQARSAPCDALGPVPPGGFILFGGEAWDFNYDWLAAVRRGETAPPPEILALQRRRQGR